MASARDRSQTAVQISPAESVNDRRHWGLTRKPRVSARASREGRHLRRQSREWIGGCRQTQAIGVLPMSLSGSKAAVLPRQTREIRLVAEFATKDRVAEHVRIIDDRVE